MNLKARIGKLEHRGAKPGFVIKRSPLGMPERKAALMAASEWIARHCGEYSNSEEPKDAPLVDTLPVA
jgi:hypothetical protein